MSKTIINTENAPKAFSNYSQAVKAGGFIFVAGQGPFDPATGELPGPTIQEQTRQALKNVSAILSAAGSTLDKVVSVTFLLGDESDFAGMNEEWDRWFISDPPARQGARLPAAPRGMKISIAVIAEA